MYLLLVDNTEHKKARDVNDNVIVAISHYEYKVFLSNSTCIRHSMNRNWSKDHRIGTFVLMTKYISKTMDITD